LADQMVPRRRFLKATALGAAGIALPSCRTAQLAPTGLRAESPGGDNILKLGVASYSLRKFPRAAAIEMVKSLGTPYINLKSVHLPYTLTANDLGRARQEIESAGLQVVGGGTIEFEQDSDDDVRAYFEYAKAAGMPLIVATADPHILPRIERFATQYDIKVAIHNHGPEDKRYPSPYDVLKHVGTMDPRMGLCIDIGHTVRAGADVVQAIADAGPRLLDMHAKDLRDLKKKDTQCVVGDGAIPIADIFRQLLTTHYRGYVNLEYEIDADAPLPGMQRSFAYMRGVLAGLGAASDRVASRQTN
jgi:sugar phosphate isomerase/epimerase